jgi:hypothetical protein
MKTFFNRQRALAAITLSTLAAVPAAGWPITEDFNLTASDTKAGDRLGSPVAGSGTAAFVGASSNTGSAANAATQSQTGWHESERQPGSGVDPAGLICNGDGTFQAGQNFATGFFPVSVAIGDLNGDVTPDLAVANRLSSTVSVLLGNGDGTFQARQDFATGSVPFSVAIGDLDGDGTPDLAVANQDSDSVSVLLNQCVAPVPSITTQPVSRIAGPAPEQVVFSVAVQSATPATYQWTRDGEPLQNIGTIAGAQTPTLTIFADASSVAEYRCVITNGGGSVTTVPAVLGFRPNPCPADLNSDASLNFLDILTYLNLFNTGCP